MQTVVRNLKTEKMFIFKTNWTPETVIALSALFVSIASVFFSARALRIQREHNYKSLKPIGVISAADYENKIFIRVDNCGVGPLVIKEVIVKNKTINASTVIDILPDQLIARITWADFATNLESKSIPVGENLHLLRWEADEIGFEQQKTIEDRRDIRNALKDITVIVEYTDIYEKNIFKVERSMEWFGRHNS
jgi:hypothetical protein